VSPSPIRSDEEFDRALVAFMRGDEGGPGELFVYDSEERARLEANPSRLRAIADAIGAPRHGASE